ncbi:expressed unknown protein [Seminavis robusta]|uniref:Uncharacterized protein n=1 Tax=Seminavis robusta TaxID=568900 RepID=A0A9N8HC15_9STRA|nr:expressed unknown protein [Seminavis robusta]|eukprot:Sro281_g107270.1 n/a (660) ;mRNA; r:32297-34276
MMIRLVALIHLEARRKLGLLLASLCSLLLPKFLHDKCFSSNRHLVLRREEEGEGLPHQNPRVRENTNDTIIRNHPNHNHNHNINQSQDDFRVSIVSRNALSVEILDGGVSLEDGVEEDDIRILQQSPSTTQTTTRLQRVIATTLQRAEHPIEKLDLFASHFRADLTAHRILSILQVLPQPQLRRLQLGGLRLPVQELCKLIAHSPHQLTHLALYDLEFSSSATSDEDDVVEQLLQRSSSSSSSSSLALEEFVAVFVRLENRTVTLDPLIRFLQSANRLKQLELVMDHSHAYIHGYPRQQPQPQLQPPCLFQPTSLQHLLQSTCQHLETVILEYVPLETTHYQAMTDHGASIKHLRLRDEPGSATTDARIRALALLLKRHRDTLESISLDGLWGQQQQQKQKQSMPASSDLFRVLSQSSSIRTVRLRSLPMQLDDLRTLLQNNATLDHLSLHSMSFCGAATTATTIRDTRIHNNNNNTIVVLEDAVVEQSVFSVLVQILKGRSNSNTGLTRLSWKQAEFRKTEVFPRRRKPKAFYRRYPYRKKKMEQQQHDDDPPSLHQQLHWYLTLNQRGIRKLMVDVNTSREQLLQQLVVQQQGSRQMQFLVPPPQTQQARASSSMTNHAPPTAQVLIQDASEKENLDEYALDCIYYLLSNNVSMICG